MAERSPRIPGYSGFQLIGRGGSATVFRAQQEQLERDVAVKVLRSGALDDHTRMLFDVERRTLGQLPKHLNIVTVFDSGFSLDSDPYLVMELCSSGSLARLVKSSGPLSLEHVVRVGTRMSSALEFAHRRNMIHRDVKPENVLISDVGEPVLSDFGIASVLGQESTATEGGMSPHHVAPELLRGAAPATTADMYSLGSTIFTLLVGYSPHQRYAGERLQIHQVLSRVVDANFTPEIAEKIDAPKSLRNLLRLLMAKDPARRMSLASEALETFRRIEAEISIAARELPLPRTVVAYVEPTWTADDPDATHIGNISTSIRTKARPSDTRDTARHRPVTERSYDAYGPAEVGEVNDNDATIIAGRPRTQRSDGVEHTEPRSTTAEQRTGTEARAQNRTLWYSAAALAVVVAAVVIGVRVSRPYTKPNAISPDQPTASLATEVVIGGRVAPRDVVIAALGPSAIEVNWTGESDQSVQYEVEILHGDSTVRTITVPQPPATITGLDLAAWVPCVRVAAIDTGSGVVAQGESICIAIDALSVQETALAEATS